MITIYVKLVLIMQNWIAHQKDMLDKIKNNVLTILQTVILIINLAVMVVIQVLQQIMANVIKQLQTAKNKLDLLVINVTLGIHFKMVFVRMKFLIVKNIKIINALLVMKVINWLLNLVF